MSKGVVVVTGASTGIGRATALRMARAGYHVFAGVRREEDARELREQFVAGLEPLMLEVTDRVSIEAAAGQVGEAAGGAGVAGLVNNAGITRAGPIEAVELDDLREVFEVNTIAPLAVTQAFMPLVRRASGRLVFVSSIGGRVAAPVIGPYAASKFALEALADALRVELRPWKIHVAVIEPGAIRTEIFAKARGMKEELEAAFSPETRRRYGAMADNVMSRFNQLERNAIDPDEVAKAIEHALCADGPRTRYLVGMDARVQALAGWLLPDGLADALRARVFGVPGEAAE